MDEPVEPEVEGLLKKDSIVVCSAVIVFAVNAFWQLSAFAVVDLSAKTRPYLLHPLQNNCFQVRT